MLDDRIVVTGLGAVTPFGIGMTSFWENVISGESAIRETADEELKQWAPVMAACQNFDPAPYLSKKIIRGSDRFTQMGIIAAMEALQDAGLTVNDEMTEIYQRERIGISIGCAFGGVQTLEEGSNRIYSGRSTRVSARLVPKAIPNAAAAGIAIQYDLHGPVMTYSTACASSANAIGEASYWLKLGKADMVIAGGAECLFSPTILSGLRAAGALAVDGPSDDFSKWSRPFDKNRTGMVMGEGAAIVILERLESAKARHAHIYAELVGYGTSNDAYHETSPDPSGKSARLAMEQALQSAQLSPSDIDYINAHATATPAGDQAESIALKELFGEHLATTPVSSIKGAVGHMLGSAGAIESIACIKAIESATLPPTINVEEKEEAAPPDIVANESRPHPINYALSNSFGFGGQNGALIWKNI